MWEPGYAATGSPTVLRLHRSRNTVVNGEPVAGSTISGPVSGLPDPLCGCGNPDTQPQVHLPCYDFIEVVTRQLTDAGLILQMSPAEPVNAEVLNLRTEPVAGPTMEWWGRAH